MNWGGEGYPAYEVQMKVSDKENQAYDAQAAESKFLSQSMQTQFAQQQYIAKFLTTQLQQMVSNPQGFGPQTMAEMRAQAINTIGMQMSAAEKGLQQQFASENMAGLGSGVEVATLAGERQAAIGQEATVLSNLDIANAQAKIQQQQFGVQGLLQTGQLAGEMPQSAQLLSGSLSNQFSESYNMAQQGGFWSNLARGALVAAGGAIGGIAGGPAGAMAGASIGANVGGGMFGGGGVSYMPLTGGGGQSAPFSGSGAVG
jgi:hypothetical protein